MAKRSGRKKARCIKWAKDRSKCLRREVAQKSEGAKSWPGKQGKRKSVCVSSGRSRHEVASAAACDAKRPAPRSAKHKANAKGKGTK